MIEPKVRTASSLRTPLSVLWVTGLKRGDSLGWDSLDELYTVAPGQMTIVTGWPSSGKSEWLDSALMNLVRQDWMVAYYSPENYPVELHLAKLIEKVRGKPFRDGPTPRMGPMEVDEAAGELGSMVQFLDFGEEAPIVDEILDAAGKVFSQRPDGIKAALVIDPWNEIDHYRDSSLSETEYIARALGRIRRWARMWDVHVFIVAHPAKQPRENGKLPIPKPDMIAGAAHWWNKADHCITVWRNFETEETEIHVLKVKFRHLGKLGMVPLKFDVVTGRFNEVERDSEGRVITYSFGKQA